MKHVTLFFNLIVMIIISSKAQNVLPMKKVSLFKNSTCLISKEGQLKTSNGKIILPVPATALYGTFWIGAAKENALKSIVVKTDTLKISSKAKFMDQLLRANIDKAVVLIIQNSDKSEKSISGKLLAFIPESGLVKIKEENEKITYINYLKVEYASFSNDNMDYRNDSITRTANLTFEKNSENVNLQEYYMEMNMSWIPSYFLKLNNDKEALLEMKATIENYAEEMSNVETEVVVGSPQLYYGMMLDPVSYDYMTQPTSYSSTNHRFRMDNNMLSNAMQQVQTAGNTFSQDEPIPEYFESNFETEGEKNNDLYYYNLGKITLSKNSKGTFPVFAATLSYKDIYKADIPDKINFATNMNCDNNNDDCDVFHSIELKNSTNFPFTTAAVMVLTEKGQFMAQDQLKYTPTGAVSSIKLSKAIDVVMKNTEEELSRIENFKKIGKTTYHKALLKGTITVENLQPKQVIIDVIKHVNGTITDASNGKVKKQKTYNSVNSYSDVTWQITLNAGEKKTLTYQYEVLFAPYPY